MYFHLSLVFVKINGLLVQKRSDLVYSQVERNSMSEARHWWIEPIEVNERQFTSTTNTETSQWSARWSVIQAWSASTVYFKGIQRTQSIGRFRFSFSFHIRCQWSDSVYFTSYSCSLEDSQRMHSSIVFFLLAAITSVFVLPTLAGDFPLVGVTLLQSQPPFFAFGSVTITQQTDGNHRLSALKRISSSVR